MFGNQPGHAEAASPAAWLADHVQKRRLKIGQDDGGDGHHVFLQVKEAQNSVLERLAPELAYRGPQGKRVVEGQRIMQAASGIFLGWTSDEASGRQFYVRILKNRRLGGASEIAEQEALSYYARLCGRTLARAHARSGDPAMIAGYMGRSDAFDDAIASFALAYTDQTIIDHAALAQAKASAANERASSVKTMTKQEVAPKRAAPAH